MKLAVIQINANEDKEANLSKLENLLLEAVSKKADLICLPEVFNLRAGRDLSLDSAEEIPGGASTQLLMNFARENKVWISNGSIFEKVENELPYNSSVLINAAGEVESVYRKNHLFRASFKAKDIDEASKSQACSKAVLTKAKIKDQEIKIGMSICYDLRFPELYRYYAKEKAELLLVPSSFAKKTGEVHWQPLLQARAIENQAYVVAANQWGTMNGLETYGNSMIVDPWGKIIARAGDKEDQVISADLDLAYLHQLREKLPALDDIKH